MQGFKDSAEYRSQEFIDRVETALKTISKVGIIPVVTKDYNKSVSFQKKDCWLYFFKKNWFRRERFEVMSGELEQGVGAFAIRIGTIGGSSSVINKTKQDATVSNIQELMKNVVKNYEVMTIRP